MVNIPAVEVVFVGGIHGSGKSSICRGLASPLRAEHLVASDLLRFKPSAYEATGKAVQSVAAAQRNLVKALFNRTAAGGRFLLDGHYAVVNGEGEVEVVPRQAFQEIQPRALVLVEVSSDQAARRIQERDGKSIPPGLLQNLARQEASHAEFVAAELGRGLIRCTTESPVEEIASAIASVIGEN